MACAFYLTGFGRFQGVSDNPTTKLMQEIPRYFATLKNNIKINCTVLETSRNCRNYVPSLLLAPTSVIIHFGVDAGSDCFKLECKAFNEANFRVPDESGWQPLQEPIEAEKEIGFSLGCKLNLEEIQNSLQGKYRVKISDSAGRFICNYI